MHDCESGFEMKLKKEKYMKKNLFYAGVAAAVLAMGFPVEAAAKSKLDASALLKVAELRNARTRAAADELGAERLPVLISIAPGITAASLEKAGVEVTSEIGNIVMGAVALADLEAVSALPGVMTVELAQTAQPKMMHALINTNASKVHGNITPDCPWNEATHGRPFKQGYLGRNVVLGLLDDGFDPNHITFYKAPDYKESRVKLIVQFDASGKEVRRWDTPEAIKGFTTEDEQNPAGHGTHVLGIMGGAYQGKGEFVEYAWHEKDSIEGRKNSDPQGCAERIKTTAPSVYGIGEKTNIPYVGMAPEADLVVCIGPLNSNTELAAANAITKYAESVGKPAVINYSLGQTFGSCDGTDNFSKAMAEIGKKAIVCIAAGNDGNKPNWISKTFTADTTKVATTFAHKSLNEQKKTSSLQGATVEIWGNSEKPFTVRLIAYDKDLEATKKVYTIAEVTGETPAGKYFEGKIPGVGTVFSGAGSITTSVMAQNNRYCAVIKLPNDFWIDDNYIDPIIGIEVEGEAGQRVDIASDPDQMTFSNQADVKLFTAGTGDMSINNMACAHNVFGVAASVNRNIFGTMHTTKYSLSGTVGSYTHTASYIAIISGYGKLVDGRQLPTITAPGYYVVSARSRYVNNKSFTDEAPNAVGEDGKTAITTSKYYNNTAVAEVDGEKYWYFCTQGTSMATPAFAGICALWLEANPKLKYKDIYEVVQNTSMLPKMKGEGLPYGTKKAGVWDETENGMAQWNANKHRYGFGNVDAYAGLKYILAHPELGSDDSAVAEVESQVAFKHEGDLIEVTGNCGNLRVALVALDGVQAASAQGAETVAMNVAGLQKGMYILTVEGNGLRRSFKVMI